MKIVTGTDFNIDELITLFIAAGWGNAADYTKDAVMRSVHAYSFTARAEEDCIIGYISAFSDNAFSVWIGEIVVHPDWRRKHIGRDLLRALEHQYPNLPIYGNALASSIPFFTACGFNSNKNMVAITRKR